MAAPPGGGGHRHGIRRHRALLLCLGPVGWIMLLWACVSGTRERRHRELLKAIERL